MAMSGKRQYLINEDTLDYLRQTKLPSYFPGYIALSLGSKLKTLDYWEQFLKERNITSEVKVCFLTEAALYASAIAAGIPRNLGVHSDDAGQFDVFVYSLCWIHEERHYRKLIMTTNEARADAAKIKLKISGGTRSDEGRKVRDTFLSLQQTCLKLCINFIVFLRDRVCGLYVIPRLAMVIRGRVLAGISDPLCIPPSSLNSSLMTLCEVCNVEQSA
jgi:hypothetical protein